MSASLHELEDVLILFFWNPSTLEPVDGNQALLLGVHISSSALVGVVSLSSQVILWAK